MSVLLVEVVTESSGGLNADISNEEVPDVDGRTGRVGGSKLVEPISPAKGSGAKGSDIVVLVGENDVHVLHGEDTITIIIIIIMCTCI